MFKRLAGTAAIDEACGRGPAATRTGGILVIDDNPSTRETLQQMLEAEGYPARIAGSVEVGLRAAAEDVPDAILLDLRMPVAGGVECLRQLRASKQLGAVPVAILTGDYFLDESVVADLSALGVRVYFKPVWDDDLRRIVTGLLDR